MLSEFLEKTKSESPLIHSITNYVTVNDVANIILACGARPIMADEAEEMYDIVSLCQGVNINIGTLNQNSVKSIELALKRARDLDLVRVLDAVGAGASRFRTRTCLELIDKYGFSIIKGNISEIKSLYNGCQTTFGVDANENDLLNRENLYETISWLKKMSCKLDLAIVVTGKSDLVVCGDLCYLVKNGRQEMTKVSGTGCMLSGILASIASVNTESIADAALCATCVMGIAGEMAFEKMNKYVGNASYKINIIDAVSTLKGKELDERANYECK